MHRVPLQASVNQALGSEEPAEPKDHWTLWIIGPSPELREKLLRTLGRQSTLIFEVCASSDEDNLSPQLLELMTDTIRHRNVQLIVVCGQPGDVQVSSMMPNYSANNAANCSGHLFQRVNARIERQRRAEEGVLVKLAQLSAHRPISQVSSLCGMFYLPESDAFLLYDHRVNRFVPLTNDSRRSS